MPNTVSQSVSGELNTLQVYNHYYHDHSEGDQLWKCAVIWQALFSASTAISGDAAEGGCKDIQYCIVIHFQAYVREDLGYEPTPKYVCGLRDN